MLFYQPEIQESTLTLTAEESLHLIRVLRRRVGDPLQITDGKGTLADAVITDANPKKCGAEIIKKDVIPPDPFYIHIAVSPTKNIDRIGWFVEKAVEIGIHEISFPICAHSERRDLKIEKLTAKAISAMKQSLSCYLPTINEAVKFPKFLDKTDKNSQKFIAHLKDQSTPELITEATKQKHYCLLIGPEGDFDPLEVDAALQAGFKMVKLGNKRLRTETAALHACSLLNAINY